MPEKVLNLVQRGTILMKYPAVYHGVVLHIKEPVAAIRASTCNDLIPSGHLLDYIPGFQLELGENSGSLLLTLLNNKLGFGEKNLITSAAAGIS